MHQRISKLAGSVAMLLACVGLAPAPATAATGDLSAALTGWNVLHRPIDPVHQTAVPWGTRSDWLQPWRAYLETPPASKLRHALGIQFNVPAEVAEPSARYLGEIGFKRARVEIPWNAMSFADPSRLDVPARWDTILGALKTAGIRPLILLNGHHGMPGPLRTFDARITQAIPAGSRTIAVDAATAQRIVPGLSGLNVPGGAAVTFIATSVSPSGVVTLSQPIPWSLPAGLYSATTLRYQPFAPPRTAGGAPNRAFEETLDGWLLYVRAVTAQARKVLGSDDFDVEIWNELPIDSSFLDVANYYNPVPPELQGTGSVPAEILARTTAWLRDPANGVSNVGIGNGFANMDPLVAGSSGPAGVTALDRHPYYGGIKPMPGYAGSIPKIRNVNALGQPEGTQDASGRWSRPFLPTYTAFFPEYYLNAISTDFMVRDLSPVTTSIDGVEHGRLTRPPGASTPTEVWITETGFRPKEAGWRTPEQDRRMQAKSVLRTLSAFTNKGATLLNFYTAVDPDWGMVDPSAPNGGETMVALQRFVQAFAGPDAITTPRSLSLSAIADRTNSAQFNGDGSAAHPPLYNRDVTAVLPFQADSNRFVVPVYVMTRNLAKVHNPWAWLLDTTRYDLPAEIYRLQIGGLDTTRLTVSATDPLTGASVPARVVATEGDQAVVEIPLTDSPRLLVLQDG